MNAIAGDPELLNHYSVFIYPFRHHMIGRKRRGRLAALDPRWAPWATRFHEHDLAVTLEATGFFLPYIRGLLYPDVVRLQEDTLCEDHAHWARLLAEWSTAGTAAYTADLPDSGVVRLTLRSDVMRTLEEFIVVRPAGNFFHTSDQFELHVRCPWIDALLFPSGLGFLLLNMGLKNDRPRMSELVHLNQSMRHVHPPARAMAMPKMCLIGGEEITVRDLMNFLTQGLAVPWNLPKEERGIFALPHCRPHERPYTDTEAGRGYGERCHLLSYGCVDLSGTDPAELPAGPFASATDRMLFEFATCIGLGESVNNPVWVPSPEQAHRLSQDHRVALWRCWTGMVLKESMVFLATEDMTFTRGSLPRHIENDYLPLYIFTLCQKLQLYTFATDMMHEVAHSCGHLRGARLLQQRFVDFRTQYWFSEVTRKPQGSELYRTLQHGLEVQNNYDMVMSSVKEVKDYYESVWSRQVQWCKDAFTYGGPVTMALGATRMLIGDSPHIWTVAAVCLFGVAIALLLRMCWPLRRSRRRPFRWRGKRRSALPDLPPMRQETQSMAA